MTDNRYEEFCRKFKDEFKINAAISDTELASATGGVGGAKEATCPKCGKPMIKKDNPYGDPIWECPTCKINQLLSDAEYIELVKAMEAAGYTKEIVYPVWWNKLGDSALANVNGGMTQDGLSEHGMKKYDAWGTVIEQNESGYIVKCNDGAEITAVFEQKHIVPNGARVGLIMLDGGWLMEELRCF